MVACYTFYWQTGMSAPLCRRVNVIEVSLDTCAAQAQPLAARDEQIERIKRDDVNRLQRCDAPQTHPIARRAAADRQDASKQAVVCGPQHVLAVEKQIANRTDECDQAADDHKKPAEL